MFSCYLFCSSLLLYVFVVYLYFVYFFYFFAASYGIIKNDDSSGSGSVSVFNDYNNKNRHERKQNIFLNCDSNCN